MAQSAINLDTLIKCLLEITAYKRVSYETLEENLFLDEESVIKYAEWIAKLGLPIGEIQKDQHKSIEIMPSAYKEKEYFTLNDFVYLLKQLPTSKVKDTFELKRRILTFGVTKTDFIKAETILKAIDSGHKVYMAVDNGEEDWSEQLNIPFQILWSNGVWHVDTYCLESNERKTFRIHRLENVQSVAVNLSVKDTQTTGSSIKATLLFDMGLKDYVMSEFHPTMIEEEETGLKVFTEFSTMQGAVNKILDYENHVKVLEPEKLKNRVADEYDNDFPPLM